MSALAGIATLCVHVSLMLAAAPVLTGFLRWLEARLLGRAGPSPLQPWRDLVRLARKQPVVALEASWLFRAAPATGFAATLAAAALVPGFALGMASGPLADLIVIAGLLALARSALALAALDVGTAFGGIGASRAVTFAAFAEPAMLMVVFTLALIAGTTNLDAMAEALREGGSGIGVGLGVPLGLSLVAVFAIAIAETGRMPLATPATRLEPPWSTGHDPGVFRLPSRPRRVDRGLAAARVARADRHPFRPLRHGGAVERCARVAAGAAALGGEDRRPGDRARPPRSRHRPDPPLPRAGGARRGPAAGAAPAAFLFASQGPA